jgi:hypothetical protein
VTTNAPPRLTRTWVPSASWSFPEDPASDLATAPFAAQPSEWDIAQIPLAVFVSPDMVNKGEVVEGDPVLFAGLFVQYAGSSRLEPIVRSGSIAMLPEDMIGTTLHKPGHIYLADTHVFNGNSGSPMFVDVDKFKATIGYDYRLLGVVAGEVYETDDFQLKVSSTFEGTVKANSGISMIVPADDLKQLLLSSALQEQRDAVVKASIHK